MKIKEDFVTNSSSASFIMTFAAGGKDFNEFQDTMNSFLEMYKDNTRKELRFWDGSNIEEVAPGVFQIEEWTSMYNDIDDIPDYMKYIIIDKAVESRELGAYGITMTNFKIDEQG
jgi:hypothetical protein